MPSITVISFSDLNADLRIMRQIRWLLDAGWDVFTIGNKPYGGLPFFRAPAPPSPRQRRSELLLSACTRAYEWRYWRRLRPLAAQLRACPTDLILANDISALPLALAGSGASRVVLDAHEYAPEEWADIRSWRWMHQPYVRYLCREYIPQCDGMMTVCQGIADRYREEFSVDPIVVTNAAPKQSFVASPTKPDEIRLVFHGGVVRSRRIESIINAFTMTDPRYSLDLYLVSHDRKYYAELAACAEGVERVNIRPPVPIGDVGRVINSYDAGICFYPPVNFNNLHTLPNKFFDYIQARLAVVTGPSPEIVPIVQDTGIGVVSHDFSSEALAAAINKLTPAHIEAYKEAAEVAAGLYSAENNKRVFLSALEAALDSTQGALEVAGA